MFKKLRQLFAAAIAAAVALLPIVLQPGTAVASDSGTLFAVFGETRVVALNPATGEMNTLADLSDPRLSFGNTVADMVSDAGHHRLYGEQVRFNFDPDRDPAFFETYQVVTIDTETGAFSISPDMPDQLTLAFDSSTGSLFGLTTNCCPFHVFRIDPATGGETPVAAIDGVNQVSNMAVASAVHSIYIVERTPNVFPATGTLLSIDTVSGAITTGPTLSRGITTLAYDGGSGILYGKTFIIPQQQLVSISTSTGAETQVGTFDLGFGGNSLTIDRSTHTIYLMEDIFEAFGFFQQVGAVSPEAGTISLSPEIPLTGYIRSLAFESVVVTVAQVIGEVTAALANGEITNPGVGTSLLAELNEASAAQSRGQCTAAQSLLQAFVNDVNAQSGKAIAPATAAKLVADAQTVTCP